MKSDEARHCVSGTEPSRVGAPPCSTPPRRDASQCGRASVAERCTPHPAHRDDQTDHTTESVVRFARRGPDPRLLFELLLAVPEVKKATHGAPDPKIPEARL